MSFAGKTIKSSNTAELLGVILDTTVNFKSHIENMCCNNKIRALFRDKNFLSLNQANVLADIIKL